MGKKPVTLSGSNDLPKLAVTQVGWVCSRQLTFTGLRYVISQDSERLCAQSTLVPMAPFIILELDQTASNETLWLWLMALI